MRMTRKLLVGWDPKYATVREIRDPAAASLILSDQKDDHGVPRRVICSTTGGGAAIWR
jgi:hypothetical protein